jgi:hypothetical protein
VRAATQVEAARQAGGGTLTALSRTCKAQAPMDGFVAGQVLLSLKNAPRRASPPLLVQAPELFAMNNPTDDSVRPRRAVQSRVWQDRYLNSSMGAARYIPMG